MTCPVCGQGRTRAPRTRREQRDRVFGLCRRCRRSRWRRFHRRRYGLGPGDGRARWLAGRARGEEYRTHPADVLLREIRACATEAAGVEIEAWATHPAAKRYRRLLRRWWALPAIPGHVYQDLSNNPIRGISWTRDARPASKPLGLTLEGAWAQTVARLSWCRVDVAPVDEVRALWTDGRPQVRRLEALRALVARRAGFDTDTTDSPADRATARAC